MKWDRLIVSVVSKENESATIAEPVVGITVYFSLYDKGYDKISSYSANTDSSGIAVFEYDSSDNAEYWDAYVIFDGRGITTGNLQISTTTRAIITVISKKKWSNLIANVINEVNGVDTPMPNISTRFTLYDEWRDYLGSGNSTTNMIGIATFSNGGLYNNAEYWDVYATISGSEIGSSVLSISESATTIKIKTSSANTWDELSVFVYKEESGNTVPIENNVVNFLLSDGRESHSLSGVTNKNGYAFATNDGTYNSMTEWSANTDYENSTFYSQHYSISGHQRGEIIVSGQSPQTRMRTLRIETYNIDTSASVTAHVACFISDTNTEYRLTGNTNYNGVIEFNASNIDVLTFSGSINAYSSIEDVYVLNYTFSYVPGQLIGDVYYIVLGLMGGKGFPVKLGTVNSLDADNNQLGVYPWTLNVYELGNQDSIYSAYSQSTSYVPSPNTAATFTASDVPYITLYSNPSDTAYTEGYTNTINLIDYLYDGSWFDLLSINIYCRKKYDEVLEVENPVIIDTVEEDLDSPVFNLWNVDIFYDYMMGDTVLYTFSGSSNSATTVFDNLNDIPGGIFEFYDTLEGRTNKRIRKTLKKHHYVDTVYDYTFVSSMTINGETKYYFCKYTTNNDVGVPYEEPQYYNYIKREDDVCYPAQMFNDYVKGFDYVYNSDINDPQEPVGRPSHDLSYFDIVPHNKLIVAKYPFFSDCYTGASMPPEEEISVSDYKRHFVDDVISTEEYYTTYTNKPFAISQNNDKYFDPSKEDFSGHAYTEHLESFWPKKGIEVPYLTFWPEEGTNGSVTLYGINIDPSNVIDTLEYSYWGGKWTPYKIGTTIELPSGTNVRFRNAIDVTIFSPVYENNNEHYYHFYVTGEKMCVKGNLSSLINSQANGNIVEGNGSFFKLFYESYIYKADKLVIDPEEISDMCYYKMFEGCTHLKYGPEKIMATTGGGYCMCRMFRDCNSMEKGPTRILLRIYQRGCCSEMFYNCHSLEYPPLLTYNADSNELGSECFGGMFRNCYSLKSPEHNPDAIYYINEVERDGYGCGWQIGDVRGELIVGDGSCFEMFKNCSSLDSTPIFKPYGIRNSGCTSMFYSCTTLTDVKFSMPFTPSSYVSYSGCAYMFYYCKSIKTLENTSLSATSLFSCCYYHMFDECHRLQENLPLIQSHIIPVSGCAYMYHNCYIDTNNKLKYINQFVTLDLTTVGGYGMAHMFDGCTYMDLNIGHRDLYHGSYISGGDKINFKSTKAECVNLYDGYLEIDQLEQALGVKYPFSRRLWIVENENEGPVNKEMVGMFGPYYDNGNSAPEGYSFSYFFDNIVLNASSLYEGCYSYMFANCDNLHYASHIVMNLDGVTIPNKGCEYMFYHCDRLFSIPLSLSGAQGYSLSGCQWMFAYDGDFYGNNKKRGNHGYEWNPQDSNFNYITYRVYENGNDLTSGSYYTSYYIYKEGLRSIQMKYNYYFDKFGNFYWPLDLEKENGSKFTHGIGFSNADSNGEYYDSVSAMSFCLIHTPYILEENNTITLSTKPLVEFSDNCFSHMFYGCKGLRIVYMDIMNGDIQESMFESIFNGCYSMKKPPTFSINQSTSSTVGNKGCYSMFKDCHELRETGCYDNCLSATTIGNESYYMMYCGCYKIHTGPKICALSMGKSAMAHMFKYCYRLFRLNGDSLPSLTLEQGCYTSMFQYCFSLKNAPHLLATNLERDCYSYMFADTCLWYYTGKTVYNVESVLNRYELTDLPATANGALDLTLYNENIDFNDYHQAEDTVIGEIKSNIDINFHYFGNYFYSKAGTSAYKNSPIITDEPYASVPIFYGIYPYEELSGKTYFREETDFGEEYYEPHVINSSDFENTITGYYSPNSRNIISNSHYTRYMDTNGKYLYALLPVFRNNDYVVGIGKCTYDTLVTDENGFINEWRDVKEFQLSSVTLTYEYDYGYGNTGTTTGNFPIFLGKDEVQALSDSLQAKGDSVKKKYCIYQVKGRYKTVNGATLVTSASTSGYSLNMNNSDYYLETKEIRDKTENSVMSWLKKSDFYIPVNDRCSWNMSLEQIYVAASALTNTYANGMTSMLNLTDGVLHAPINGNYSDVLPVNWDVENWP